jgi:uncharacterized protein (TIGR02001 family)
MLNKKLLTAAVATAVLTSAGFAQAHDKEPAIVTGDSLMEGFEISANVALVSDYRFRGISQTGQDAAVQGGFDAAFGPGFYIGTWASSVDFGDLPAEDGSYGTMEIDYYAGWASSIGDTDFGVDVGYMYYQYPGDTTDPEGDYQEFYIGGSWKDLSLKVNYSDDYYAETDEFWYVSGDYSFTLLEDLTIGLHVGYNMLEELEFRDNGSVKQGGFLSSDEDAYTDYSVTVTYNWATVDFSVAYVGTDLDEEDVFDTDNADGTAVFSISKSL